MVSESTWRVHIVLMFILARNYNGFVVDMDSLGWIMFEFTKEFQCFFVRLPFKLYFRLRPATKSIKTASGAPRPKSAPRGSKSTTFAQGKFQVSNRQKMVANPIGEPSVSPFQYPIYLWLQAAVWEASWRLVCRELQVDTVSEIYGSSIGVCN